MTHVKGFVLFAFLCLYATHAEAKTKVFRDLKLNEGKWTLFGKLCADPDFGYVANPLRDSLGVFFIRDITVLKEMQKEWKFSEINPELKKWDFNYYYELDFIRNDTDHFYYSISADFTVLWDGKRTFRFESSRLRDLMPKVKKLPQTKLVLYDLDKARKVYDLVQASDSAFMYVYQSYMDDYTYPSYPWLYYPGYVRLLNFNSNIQPDSFVANCRTLFEETFKSPYEIYYFISTREYVLYCSETDWKPYKEKELGWWVPFSDIKFDIYGYSESQINELVK